MSAMKFYTQVVSSATTGDWIAVDRTNAGSVYSINLVISDTATASVEAKLDADGSTIELADFTDATATTFKAISGPFTHFRINCSAFTSGTVTLELLQSC